MLLAAVFVLLSLCSYIKFVWSRRRLYKLASQFNGPRPLPLVGNILNCLIPLSEIPDIAIRSPLFYKSPQRIWFGPVLVLHIFDPEDVRIVLNSSHALAKPQKFYGTIEFATDRGLLTSPVKEWKRHRKLMGPSFSQKSTENFFECFRTHSHQLAADLEAEVGREIFNVHGYIGRYAINCVMENLLGSFEDAPITPEAIIKSVETLLATSTIRLTKIWYYFDFIFKNSKMGRQVIKIKDELDSFMISRLDQWKKNSSRNATSNGIVANVAEPKKFIEHLLAISDGHGHFTAEEIRGEARTFLVAGFETITITVGYVLILLGMHPDIQEKLYEEIKQVIGSKQELELEDLKHMALLERVIKESLRIFPPTAGFARYTKQEIKLTNHTIPANTIVVIGPLAMHRNAEIWPDPNKFDPDRFLPEKADKHHPYSWIPFSAGPRDCIGRRYAWMSLKTVIYTIVSKYKVTTEYKCVEEIKMASMFKLQPTEGFKIGITGR